MHTASLQSATAVPRQAALLSESRVAVLARVHDHCSSSVFFRGRRPRERVRDHRRMESGGRLSGDSRTEAQRARAGPPIHWNDVVGLVVGDFVGIAVGVL